MSNDLKKYIESRRPIIWINSNDYKEIDSIIKEATKDISDKETYEYRATGVIVNKNNDIFEGVFSLSDFLGNIYDCVNSGNIFIIIKNVDDELKMSINIAHIRNIAEKVYSDNKYNATVIIISESTKINKELEKYTSILDIPNMTQNDIKEYVIDFSRKFNIKLDEDDLGELSISLKGLTKLEIDHILNMVVAKNNNISFSSEVRNMIIREKGQIIKKSSILEIIDFKEGIDDIGGLNGLKEWLEMKAKIFRNLDEAKEFGVDTPKGVLLVGMPGCGKSLSSKACARLFNVPLLRLDIGRLLGKYVGESEHNMRIALKTAESISPCILWVDEIEKAFSGIDQNGGASDITKRLFGQFLTWLQEKENTVFVVATANDITAFPPEFLRKGRFDEIFFVDFPDKEEREKIFEIHLKKRNKLNNNIDISKLARNTEGYCGADIEEIVKHAVETKYVEGKNEDIKTEDLENSIKNIDSLKSILKEQIEKLNETYKKYKIKSARKSIKNTKKSGAGTFEDMVVVNGGKYKPSFRQDEVKVMDLEVSKYQVTNNLWNKIMKNTSGDMLPVENITYWQALEFCNKLSEKYGLKPVYKINDNSIKIIELDGKESHPQYADFSNTEGFRLPTEVEWEWFARGGEVAIQNNTFGYTYSGSDNIDEVSVYNAYHRDSRIAPVGIKKSNQLGLYDCCGNVWEWCYDTWGKNVYTENGFIYDESEGKRVLRGGSWNSFMGYCTVIYRENREAEDYFNSGFRVVRTL